MIAQHSPAAPGSPWPGSGCRAPRPRRSACIDADETATSPSSWRSPPTRLGMPDDPDVTFASMGNYIFTTEALLDALRADAEDGDSDHDMGGDIIPRMVGQGEAHVYDFADNVVPGATDRDSRLLARRRHARRLLRGAHRPGLGAPDLQPLQPALADPHGDGAAAARQVRGGRHRAGLDRRRRDDRLRGDRAPVGDQPQRADRGGRRGVRLGRACPACASGRGAVVARRDPRQERGDPRRRAGRGRPGDRPGALHGEPGRRRGARQGRHRSADHRTRSGRPAAHLPHLVC